MKNTMLLSILFCLTINCFASDPWAIQFEESTYETLFEKAKAQKKAVFYKSI